LRSVRWAVAWGGLLLGPSLFVPATSAAAPPATGGNWYARIRANDAPIAGRLTVFAYLLDSLDVAVPLPGPGRLLALNVREANGANSFFVPGDLALEGRNTTKWTRGFSPLGVARLAGAVGERESRWALWWIPLGSDSLVWNAVGDLRLTYGFGRSLFVPLPERDVTATLEVLPWKHIRAAALDASRGTADPQIPVDPAAFEEFPVVRTRKDPVYPRSAKLYAFDGSVHVVAEVSETGSVKDAWVLASDAVHDLNMAALAAVMDWTFKPGKKAGKPVSGEMIIPVRFSSGWSP
jgi:protein TonB